MAPQISIFLLAGAMTSFAEEPKDIGAALEPLRVKYHLPACASAVIEHGRLVAIGATGLRSAASTERVTTADIWHIGSCTKSMTATLVGMLIDDGKLRWDLSVAEALSDVPANPAWHKVTIWDLAAHQSGLEAGAIGLDRSGSHSPSELRATFARQLLARAPQNPPGNFKYSNAGYGLLGVIIERAAGLSYEEMLRQRIFTPLDLRSAGFGPPATPGRVDQPWGHRRDGEDHVVPVAPTPDNQFPPPLAPAACVHMTIQDFGRYAAWLGSNEPPLLQPGTAVRLKTPPGNSAYAGGLWKTEFPGRPGSSCFCHTGNLGGFFAVFYTSPETICVTVFNAHGGGWEWLGDVLTEAVLHAASSN